MELKVGMYVKFKDGSISKIVKIDKDILFQNVYPRIFVEDEKEPYIEFDFIKASYDIIDLIEVGDYVNGYLVKNVRSSCNENLGGHPKQIDIGESENCTWLDNIKIKSILTKEQFESMAYKVN